MRMPLTSPVHLMAARADFRADLLCPAHEYLAMMLFGTPPWPWPWCLPRPLTVSLSAAFQRP